MKNLFFGLGTIILFSITPALSDIIAVKSLLPNNGKDCMFVEEFVDGPLSCSANGPINMYQLWHCSIKGDDLCSSNSTGGNYLVTGSYSTDLLLNGKPVNCVFSPFRAIQQSVICP